MFCRILIASFALATSLITTSAFAGQCSVSTTRYACPGQEQESYAKCGGLQSCVVTSDAVSVDQCAALALKACENQRFQITKYKAITAQFEGLTLADGADFCDKDSGAYIVKANFPFRDAPSCN